MLAFIAIASVTYVSAQEWQPYYVVEVVEGGSPYYWFQIDWKNKFFYLESDSDDDTKGRIRNYKENGTKKTFDVYYAEGKSNDMIFSVEFNTEQGEDRYSIVLNHPGSMPKDKFILSTKEPDKSSSSSDVRDGKPKSLKEGVNKTLNKINVFKKKNK